VVLPSGFGDQVPGVVLRVFTLRCRHNESEREREMEEERGRHGARRDVVLPGFGFQDPGFGLMGAPAAVPASRRRLAGSQRLGRRGERESERESESERERRERDNRLRALGA